MTDVVDRLENAREAASRYSWSEAFDLFAAADAAEPLGPDDLDAMAACAWWVGKMRHCIALRERAQAAYLKEGNVRRAARMAVELADHHSDLVEMSVASAWLQRASKLLEDEPESVEHGWLALAQAIATRGEWESSRAFAAKATELGGRYNDKDLMALGLALAGMGLVYSDDVSAGIAMLEEATVGAVSGELGPYATGWIYCMMISASADTADWQRAGQWTEAAKRWCDRQAINGFPGVCRVHRAEIMRLRGSFFEAEEEARIATDELGSFNLHFSALAFRELGDIRLRMGEIGAAEEAFRQANEMGIPPQPGMAMIQLLQGKPEAAAKALKRALSLEGLPHTERAKLLPTQVEAALALGDLETARAAVAELVHIADEYSNPASGATAAAATAALGLAEGDFGAAEDAAKRACRLYNQADLTYDAAKTTLLLGRIYLAEGDTEAAQFEISSALSTFERLGAVPDAQRARDLLSPAADAPASTDRRVTKTFLFSDIVKSTNLLDAIGDDAWTHLLKWHDDTLRKLFAEHGGEEIAHTGDGFFIAFEKAEQAVDCAIAIQRSLERHRREHGFSPRVRIGVHATEAAEVQGNYHGKGVHEAARIGALAEAGEVLVSAPTLECFDGGLRVRDQRRVELKGVSEPVEVASIDWSGS